MGNSDLLFESIFKRKISDADTREYLIQITNDYPYFSPAQFFSLLLTEKETTAYKAQAAKTSVLFNNPYWLQFQLQEKEETADAAAIDSVPDDNNNNDPIESQEVILPETIGPNDIPAAVVRVPTKHASDIPVTPETIGPNEISDETETKNIEPTEKEISEDHSPAVVRVPTKHSSDIPGTPETIGPNEILDEPEIINIEHAEKEIIEDHPIIISGEPTPSEPEANGSDIIADEESAPVIDDAIIIPPEETTGELVPEDIIEPASEEHKISDEVNSINHAIVEKEILPGTAENEDVPKPGEKETITISLANESGPTPGELENSDVSENKDAVNPELHSGHFNNDSEPLINETDVEEGPVSDEEIAPLNFKLNIDTANTTEENITFEPLHTSDYFASIGIKLSGDIIPSDKLGKQLKSFTDWLKTMKKIHNDQLPPLSGQADISIQKLAEESNKEDTVVTEAMADVLLQQGKAEKAVEVYKKLSLLNPSKSTYFAAKIDQLKEH